MFFSRALQVVFKNTGGKRWNGRDGLQPLTASQQKNRRKNTEQTMKNMSILKMAAANEPEVPTRLYKPLTMWKIMWMKRKLQSAKTALGWDAKMPPSLATRPQQQAFQAMEGTPAVSYEARVLALAAQLRAKAQLSGPGTKAVSS